MEEIFENALGLITGHGFHDHRHVIWQPLYLLLILELKSRKILRFDLTENPCREFVKQRIELVSEDFSQKKTLIHDNAAQFTTIDYTRYDIKGVNICTNAPNMNAYAERLIGTIRREAPESVKIDFASI